MPLDDELPLELPLELLLVFGGVYGSVYQPTFLYASTSDFNVYLVLPSAESKIPNV